MYELPELVLHKDRSVVWFSERGDSKSAVWFSERASIASPFNPWLRLIKGGRIKRFRAGTDDQHKGHLPSTVQDQTPGCRLIKGGRIMRRLGRLAYLNVGPHA